MAKYIKILWWKVEFRGEKISLNSTFLSVTDLFY